MEILFLSPVFKQMIWGGNRLGSDWPYQIPGDHTGECWAVSAHPNGDCMIKGGTFAGETLSSLWEKHRELFGNMDADRFPLLVKIIDAKEDLSIQVHPDDTYAGVHENGSLGKTECWYILDAKEGAKLVIGHNAGTREELKDMICNGKWNELIREVPVSAGDFIQIDPGTVHAIKGGIMLLEIQQNSDITYRVYDYDRLSDGKPRELHVEKSMDVITVPALSVEKSICKVDNTVKNQPNLLISNTYYKVWKLDVEESMRWEMDTLFTIMSVVDGEGTIDGTPIRKGDHFILPNGYNKAELCGELSLMICCSL